MRDGAMICRPSRLTEYETNPSLLVSTSTEITPSGDAARAVPGCGPPADAASWA